MKFFSTKRARGILLLFFVGVLNIQILFTANLAQAQWVTSNPDILGKDVQKDITDKFTKLGENAVVKAISAGLVNLIIYEVNTLAYNSAVWVASGGNSEDPLFDARTAEDFMRDAGASIASAAISEIMSVDIGDLGIKFGVNLPDDPNLRAAIANGVRSAYIPTLQDPDFDFNDIKNNWQGYLISVASDSSKTSVQKTGAVLQSMSKSFDPGANEFTSAFQIYSQTIGNAQIEAKTQTEEFQRNDGFQNIVNAISGKIETPASFIEDKLKNSIERADNAPFDITKSLMANKDALIQIGLTAGSIFANTLISELTQKLEGGIFADIAGDASSINPFAVDSLTDSSRSRAQERNKALLAFKPLATTDINLLSDYSSCPSSFRGISRQLNNCVMDTSFSSAVARADSGDPLTISEAIDQGYINGDWPLIPSSDSARNQDQNCYTYGFCHSNLLKLRKARIVSIGWELAAESSSNSSSSPVTLTEVMDAFNDCNVDGQLDDAHPWCHLIDPNWVLRYPQVQCRTLAYGQRLSASGVDSRAEECVDLQSCISEDENGNCTGGWGYCVEEKNTWKFRGDDCPEQYASCQAYKTVDDEEVDFLTNTIDVGSCDADNAGCLWYASIKKEVDGTFEWPNVNDEPDAEEQVNADRYRIYVDSDAETCSEGDAGCAALVERTDGTLLNMINNPTFEVDEDGDSWPDGWAYAKDSSTSAIPTYDTANDKGRSGDAAMSPVAATLYQMGLKLNQNTFYTFSFYAKQTVSTGTDHLTFGLFLEDPFSEEDPDLSGYSYTGDCAPADLNADGVYESMESSSSGATYVVPSGSGYERYTCSFTTPRLAHPSKMLEMYVDFFSADVWIDDVQLEQGETASIFQSGYGTDATSLTYTYGVLPPAYLGCGGSDTEPAECDNYAQICSADDEGCTAYTPANGDGVIYGVAKAIDACDSACSGYDTYKQEPTRYEPNGSFPEYLIPATGDDCKEAAVGCDEFTNLSTEAKEYYTYLRSCVTPAQALANTRGDGEATFYTWEGSDVEGYQLVTWHLLESNLDAATYATHTENGTAPGEAPCTNWSTTTSGVTCRDDQSGNDIYDDYSTDCDAHEDIVTNPDCREFYDADGDLHYRLWSNTVTVADACVSYRKTDIAGLGDDTNGDGTDDGEANCEDSGGYFDSALSACRYEGLVDESTECAESDNGCRQYTGGRSNNSRLAFSEYFESDLTGWDSSSATDTTTSNESIATDGHSLLTTRSVWTYLYDYGAECTSTSGCASTTGLLGGECTVSEGQETCGTLNGQLFTDKTYTISFWAKGSGTVQPAFDIDANARALAAEVPFDTAVTLGDTWHEYVLGPLDMNSVDYPTFGNGTALFFKIGTGTTLYLDNVVVREGEDNVTLLKDSWVTPAACDQDENGNSAPQYQLGCAEYTDADGDTAYLKSFSKLCSEDKVGCTGYYNTMSSDSATAEMRNVECQNIDATSDGTADTVSSATDCHLFTNDTNTAFDTDSPVLCTISGGRNSCAFDTNYLITRAAITSDSRLAHIYFPADAVRVPADQDVYAILGENTCTSDAVGCTELGQPTFTSDGSSVDSYESVYLINDPDTYDDVLCSTDTVGCNAFDAGDEGISYFIDPFGQTCEYKTDVSIGDSTYDGWFRKDENEFCSGTGLCTNGTTACSTDSDCRTGTCSDNSAVCYSDFDCHTDATCNVGDLNAVCNVTEGTYLIGGDASGMWRNGDTQYTGWVGECTAEWSGCSEFQDPMDYSDSDFYAETDGVAYDFIDNTNLDENSLLSSQQCDDQVSQKLGCVLFNDTGITGYDYNASATYTASIHADVLFGDTPFALVDPIDCSSGEVYSTITTPAGDEEDLCAARCTYENEDLYPVTVGDISLLDNDPTTGYTQDEIYTFGTSCYEDSDCASYQSENGDTVTGSCKTRTVVSADASDNKTYEDVPRLENDTNRILKVNRDRACEKWLTCDSSQTVWDATTGTYKTICDSVDLCTEYASGSGDASFCSAWDTDNEPLILDAVQYSARDVTWYGDEYSSYSIPEAFPAQFLSQINVAATGTCSTGSGTADLDGDGTEDSLIGHECVDDGDCDGGTCSDTDTGATDYRLAYTAGECSTTFGTSCSAGYCEDSGTLCTHSDDCPGTSEACLVGKCYSAADTAVTCESDDECTDDQTCISGTCMDNDGDCRNAATSEDYSCVSDTATAGDNTAGNASCYISANVYEGTCYRDTCVVNPNGQPFDAETSESQVCRAYPEQDSPFPEAIVSNWTELGLGSRILTDRVQTQTVGSSIRLVPYTRLAGFDQAKVCSSGEDCECNYKKLGSSTGVSRYVGSDSQVDEIVADLVSEGGVGDTTSVLGICSGGANDGTFCLVDQSDTFCGDPDDTTSGTSAGTCYALSKEDSILGMLGYCMERDTGINILGDAGKGACLTWLPVDQLQGSTDLYAKYKAAGYFDDTYMCSDARPYLDLKVSNHTGYTEGEIACAENGKGWGTCKDAPEDAVPSCAQNVECPKDFYAIMGMCMEDGAETEFNAACYDSGGADTDCPYICVPEGAYSGSDPCDDMLSNPVHGFYTGGSYGTSVDGTTVYVSSSDNFTDLVTQFGSCQKKGVQYKDEDSAGWLAEGDDCTANGSDIGCRDLSMNYIAYPGCRQVIQTAASDEDSGGSFAWTDRIMRADSYAIDTSYGGVSYTDLAYTSGTLPTPFGAAYESPNTLNGDKGNPPFRITYCYDSTEVALNPPTAAENTALACAETDPYDGIMSTPGDPMIRSYLDFSIVNWGIMGFPVDDIWTVTPSGDAFDATVGRINQVFAKPNVADSAWVWLGDWDSDEEYQEESSSAYSTYDVRPDEGIPPKVWAIDTDHCYGSYCREGSENELTLNSSNDTDQTGAGGFFRATLKFFAAADKNQLPIRRVIVDWGDGGDMTGSSDTDNYYKNHRGLLETSQTTSICDTCNEGTDAEGCEWGMTADSCDPNYFTYQHNYSCNDSDLRDLPACSDVDPDGDGFGNEACTDNGMCVFRPRVHVRDNWGWCGGTCTVGPDASGDGSGCYDSDGSMNGSSSHSAGTLDECDYTYFPTSSVTTTDPWIYYNGVITVEP